MTEPATSPDPVLLDVADRLRRWFPQFPEGRFAGRGIVVAAGGARIFTNAYVLAWVLRRTLQCRLPIEVWHFGAAEMSPSMAALLDELDVRVIDALPKIAAAGATIRDGWQLKSFMLLHSSFEEALLLDADQVPVSDPAALFDWPEYAEAGAVFWPDIVKLRAENPVWESLGLAGRRTTSFESGQILVDKRRHWRALSIACALNAEAERLYRLIYGDKDSFLLAWLLAEAQFRLVPHQPFGGDRLLVQRDFAGAPLFQHRTGAKWSYAGAETDIEGFRHLAACREALSELRRRWNGRVFRPPDRSVLARAAEAVLQAQRHFHLEVPGEERLDLDLLPHGELGEGRALDRQNWWCAETPAGMALLVTDGDRITYRFAARPDGRWSGSRHRLADVLVTLSACSPATGKPEESPGLVDELLRAAGFPDETPEDGARLAAALELLWRVEPGMRDRLQSMLTRASGTAVVKLAALLEHLPPDKAPPPVNDDNAVLKANYRPVLDDSNV